MSNSVDDTDIEFVVGGVDHNLCYGWLNCGWVDNSNTPVDF